MPAPVLSDDDRNAAIELASKVGAPVAAAQYGVKPATLRAWMSWAGVSSPPARTNNATVARRVAQVLSAADNIEDYLEQIRSAAAVHLGLVTTTAAQYAYKVSTMNTDDIIPRRDKETGLRWIEFSDAEAEGLRKQMLALAEASVFTPKDALATINKVTHDLRLLREQSTENVATSVSFDPALQPKPITDGDEILEADEVD